MRRGLRSALAWMLAFGMAVSSLASVGRALAIDQDETYAAAASDDEEPAPTDAAVDGDAALVPPQAGDEPTAGPAPQEAPEPTVPEADDDVPLEAVATSVSYVERSWGGREVASEEKTRDDVISVPSSGDMTSGWYILDGNVTEDGRIESITGGVNLIPRWGSCLRML